MPEVIPKREATPTGELPQIPPKRYFTIGEVAHLCQIKPHVLRYWEQEFPSLQQVKRRAKRRYYQRHHLLTIRQIRHLLYEQGYTIEGARNHLASPANKKDNQQSRQLVRQMIVELEDLLKVLK